MTERLRHVMGADEVAHTWANPRSEDDNARVPHGNFYFQGDTIYSYGPHFPIARHVTNDRDERAVMFTTDTYGPTTGKHLGITRRACHHLNVFEVPSSGDRHGAGHHNLNMADYQRRYDRTIEGAEKLTCAGYDTAKLALGRALETLGEGNRYAAFFDLDDCVIPAWQRHLEWIEARYTRLKSPEAQAERDRKARAKNARLLERWIAGDDVSLPGSIDPTEAETKLRRAIIATRYSAEIAAYSAGERDHIGHELKDYMTGAQVEQRQAFDIKRHEEKIKSWRAGESVSFGYGTGVPCMLRLYGQPPSEEVETSWSARFPVEDATRAFRFIQIIRKRGECYIPNGEQAPTLGHYKIDRIAADGTVRAGCHTVAWSEIEGIARQLGLIPETIGDLETLPWQHLPSRK